MNIWLISIFEQTVEDNVFSTRFISIAEEALKKEHKVHFFASTFKHNTKNQRYIKTTYKKVNDKYNLTFVKSLSYKKNIGFLRLYSHFKFGNDIINELNKFEKPDIILLAYPPNHLAFKISKWANENNIPIVLDIIDPWPDTFAEKIPNWLTFIKPFIFNIFDKKLAYTLKNASAIISISKQYLNWAESKTLRKLSTKCFYPAVDLTRIQNDIMKLSEGEFETKSSENLTVIYAGSLASSYDIPCILAAAELLEKKYLNKITFKIAGVGPYSNEILEYVQKHKNVDYLGRLSKPDLIRQYFYSDLGLTQHKIGASQTVTYKLFDLLANGLPILNSLKSEMNDIILDNKVGLFNEPGDFNKLAENIEFFYNNRNMLSNYKKNAVTLTSESGDSTKVYRELVEFLESRKLINTVNS
jgi:glycosyltransferase involved in cell wall biosynthesis